jgi:lipopolysaccharide export system protein LptC
MKISSVKRYSNFVLASKKICALIAGVILVTLVIFPLFNSSSKQLELSFSAKSADNSSLDQAKTQMQNPKFYGINLDKEQYNFSAQSAVEMNKNQVSLNHPVANIDLKDNKKLELFSDQGLWQQIDKILHISGSVKLFYENYQVTTDAVSVDVANDYITGDKRIEIVGPLGHLIASGFKTQPNSHKIYFTGPVKVILYKDKKKG